MFPSGLGLRHELTRHKTDLIAIGALLAACVVIFGFALRRVILGFDYGYHITWAEEMAAKGATIRPNFLYQLLILIARFFIPFPDFAVGGATITSFVLAAFGVALAFYLLLSLILFTLLRDTLKPDSSTPAATVSALVAICLIIVTPASLFTALNHNLYLGYIGINLYHNPTMVILKPLALWHFWLVTGYMLSGKRSWGAVAGVAAMTALATLAKTNYIICFAPILMLWAAYRLFKKEPVNWPVIAGVLTSLIMILSWQYYQRYVFESQSQIIFAPFLVMGSYSPSGLLPRFFLSILFPLGVYGLYFKQARNDTRLNLAWLTFAIGLFFTYFIAESEPRTHAGDFTWSGQIGLFILFVCSTLFLIGQARPAFASADFRKLDQESVICSGLFALHLVSGIIFYSTFLGNNASSWW